MTGGPLDGVRVVDLTTIVIGPICSRTLADYGADVIKVEAPGGDLLRTMAEGSRNPGMSGKFINFNRNKRSIGLDIKQKEGLEALLRLDEEGELLHGPGAELLAREGLLPGQPLQVGDGANGRGRVVHGFGITRAVRQEHPIRLELHDLRCRRGAWHDGHGAPTLLEQSQDVGLDPIVDGDDVVPRVGCGSFDRLEHIGRLRGDATCQIETCHGRTPVEGRPRSRRRLGTTADHPAQHPNGPQMAGEPSGVHVVQNGDP